ncbi:MAG: hypothetical protein ACLGHN_08470 [Bacteriovoracia bacterium]
MYFLLIPITVLFISWSSQAEELEFRLKSLNKTSVSPYQAREVTASDAVKLLREAVKKTRNMSPTEEAEFFYQMETDNRPCIHCPEYLGLIREVNQIVEKLPANGETVGVHNESMIQLNRLKFLYYETKAVEEDGDPDCLKPSGLDPFPLVESLDGSFELLAEEALSLPNVRSFQYYPENDKKRMHYFYRGEGPHSNVIIEVVVYHDQKAVIRYHHYRPKSFASNKLPGIGEAVAPAVKPEKKETWYENLDDNVDSKQEIKVSEDMGITTESQVKLKEQKTKISLKDSTGKNWVVVDAEHKTAKELSFNTIIPVEWKLNEEGLKVGGHLNYKRNEAYLKGEGKEESSAVFALTDHNHEYFKTSVVSRENAQDIITLSSRYSLGDYGSVSAVAERDEFGRRNASIGHVMGDPKDSVLTTRVGMDSQKNAFFEIQKEQQLSKTSSMVLSFKTTQDGETYVLYQFKALLK